MSPAPSLHLVEREGGESLCVLLLNLSKHWKGFCLHLLGCALWHAPFAHAGCETGWLSKVLPICAEGPCPLRPIGDDERIKFSS